jgi:hypothetical protein
MSMFDNLFGYDQIASSSGAALQRRVLKFIGATVTDDPSAGATVVTVPSAAAISSSAAQAVGTTGAAGSSGNVSDAGHVHALGEATLRTVAASLTAALDLGAQLVKSTGTPTLSSHLTTKTYVDTADASTLASAQSYADSIFQGRDWKQSCRLATATALTTCTYNNGASGVGATLTASANGILQVDGVNAASGDRVLVKNQSAGEQHGIYCVYATGSAGAPWVLKRDTDADSAAKLTSGAAAFVTLGVTNSGCAFFLDTQDPITIGTTALVFGQLPDQTVAGTGLARSGNTLSVTYGTTSGTSTQGNDSRLAPAPSVAGRILYDTGSAWAALAAGTSGQVLTSGGAAAPSWAAVSSNGARPATASGTSHWWKLDESSGTTFADSIGSAHITSATIALLSRTAMFRGLPNISLGNSGSAGSGTIAVGTSDWTFEIMLMPAGNAALSSASTFVYIYDVYPATKNDFAVGISDTAIAIGPGIANNVTVTTATIPWSQARSQPLHLMASYVGSTRTYTYYVNGEIALTSVIANARNATMANISFGGAPPGLHLADMRISESTAQSQSYARGVFDAMRRM